MKLLPFLFSCVYSGVKLFVFAIKSRRRFSIFVWFIYGLEERSSKAEVIFRDDDKDDITSAFEFFSSNQLITTQKSINVSYLLLQIQIISLRCTNS